MKRKLVAALGLAVIGIMATSTAIYAYGRDADGSRMQARSHALGSSKADRLNPPTDSVDWRYVRLKAAQKVTVSVTNVPKDVALSLLITDAVGKPVASQRSAKGAVAITRELKPGLYYISVSSNTAVKYTISIR